MHNSPVKLEHHLQLRTQRSRLLSRGAVSSTMPLDDTTDPDAFVSIDIPLTAGYTSSADIKNGYIIHYKVTGPKMGTIVSFKDLSYTVQHRKTKEDIRLLQDLSGFMLPGQMTALMGPSGSGKTTLLDVLAGRKTMGSTSGDILFGAKEPTRAFLKRHTGYVEQFDTLLESLTVEEMLMYTAELKLPTSMSKSEKRAKVDEMVAMMQLTKCKDTKIGSALSRGISGGQAKRVNIAISLITDPSVMFLDEPTSGLDSHTATEVMKIVKELASQNRTICATIHSPSAYTFHQFNSLIILLDGRMAYFGKNGAPALEYFSQPALTSAPFKPSDNEAEWIVEVTTAAAQQGDAQRYADEYRNSELSTSNLQALDDWRVKAKQHEAEANADSKQNGWKKESGTSVGFFKAFATLFQYRSLRNYRDPQYMGPRIAEKVMVAVILMTLYLHLGSKVDQRNVQNVVGMLFMWCTLASFGSVQYTPTLVLGRALFYRERADGLYTVGAYLFTTFVEELLLAFVTTGLLALPVYYLVGLKGSFLLFWMVYYVTLCVGIAAAYFFAAVSPSLDVANALLPGYMVSLLYFSGLVMNFNSIPVYWKWYSYIDFVRYGFTALMINQFDERDVKVGDKHVLDFYGIDSRNAWLNVGYEACFAGAFMVLAYVALRLVRHDKR